jgi:hypothetical protein
MAVSPAEPENKNDCAGKGQQKFTRNEPNHTFHVYLYNTSSSEYSRFTPAFWGGGRKWDKFIFMILHIVLRYLHIFPQVCPTCKCEISERVLY